MSATTNGRSDTDTRPAEERAEELVERVTADASRVLRRAFGRAREEVEDILAEARSLNEGRRSPSSR